MVCEGVVMETGNIVRDFVAFKLKLCGYNNWGNGGNARPTSAMRTMRFLGQQFEEAYNNAFEDMTQNIDVLEPEAREAFFRICTVLFENGIQWGRIVGLVVFAAKLAAKAMEANVPTLVDNIVLWATDHLNSPTFSSWITQNGGWDGFVTFYERPENQNHHEREEFSWTKACSLGIATLAGAAAAIHLFVQKS